MVDLIIGFILVGLFIVLLSFAFRFENRLRKICPNRKEVFFLSLNAPYNFMRYFQKMEFFQTNDGALKKLKRNIVISEFLVALFFVIVAVYYTVD